MGNGFKPPSQGGEGLNPEQEDAVDSIVNAPDNKLLLARSGVLEPSTASQMPDEKLITNEGAYEAEPSSGFLIGEAWSLNSAGTSIGAKDLAKNKNYRIHTGEIGGSMSPSIIKERAPITFVAQPVDTDTITNPNYSITIPIVDPGEPEDGQTTQVVKVKVDPSSVTDNVTLEFMINGVLFSVENVDLTLISGNNYNIVYEFPIDIEVGDLIEVSIYSDDGDVILLGDDTIGVPYLEPTVILWDYKEVAFSEDLSGLAEKSNVLELDNTDAFTPDADYEPATKKYVDDNAGLGYVLATWGANLQTLGRHPAVNGAANTPEIISLGISASAPVPAAGTIDTLTYYNSTGDNTTEFQIIKNGVVMHTFTCTGPYGVETGINVPTGFVGTVPDNIAIRYSSGTAPGEGIYSMYIK